MTVLLISPEGTNLGEHSLEKAEQIAEEQYGLDLVEVRPGVYKILNSGKLKYEASKRKQPKTKPIKEMKFTLKIGPADFQTKVGHVRRFLDAGHSVRVTVWFSGREVNNPDAGVALMNNVAEAVKDLGDSNINTALQGKNMYMVIEPKKGRLG